MWLRGCAASFCVPSKEDSLEELRTCDKLWYSRPFIFNCVLLNQQYWCKEWLTSWSPVRRDPNLGPDSANELPKMYLHRIELKQEKYYLNHKKSTGPPGPETSIWWPFWLALTSSFGPLALNSNTPDPRKGDHCHLLVHLLQWPFNPLAHKMGVYMY